MLTQGEAESEENKTENALRSTLLVNYWSGKSAGGLSTPVIPTDDDLIVQCITILARQLPASKLSSAYRMPIPVLTIDRDFQLDLHIWHVQRLPSSYKNAILNHLKSHAMKHLEQNTTIFHSNIDNGGTTNQVESYSPSSYLFSLPSSSIISLLPKESCFHSWYQWPIHDDYKHINVNTCNSLDDDVDSSKNNVKFTVVTIPSPNSNQSCHDSLKSWRQSMPGGDPFSD